MGSQRHHRTRSNLPDTAWSPPHGPSHRTAFIRIARPLYPRSVERGSSRFRSNAPGSISSLGGGTKRQARGSRV